MTLWVVGVSVVKFTMKLSRIIKYMYFNHPSFTAILQTAYYEEQMNPATHLSCSSFKRRLSSSSDACFFSAFDLLELFLSILP